MVPSASQIFSSIIYGTIGIATAKILRKYALRDVNYKEKKFFKILPECPSLIRSSIGQPSSTSRHHRESEEQGERSPESCTTL